MTREKSDTQPTRVERPLAPSRPDREEPAREPPRPQGARYANGNEIARGGMGRVVEATDQRLGRVVAVKEALTDDPDALRRFARETRITARLEHPSIVPLYDAGGGGDDGTPPYYVMRKVTGQPLADLVDAATRLDERLALLPHLIATAQAIAHAHKRGVIHRDLKPTNILVGELGETVVIDWGLATVVGEPDDDVGRCLRGRARDHEPGGDARRRALALAAALTTTARGPRPSRPRTAR